MSRAFGEKNQNISIRSQKITTLRNALGLSADRFGASIGYVGGYIFNIESGLYNASNDFCEKVALTFGVNRMWLMDERIPVEPILHGTNDQAVQDRVNTLDERTTPGERLREIFESSGMTQREFCAAVGSSTSTLVPMMDGRRQITARYAQKIEKEFHVGVDWLLYGREECKENPCGDEMIAFLKSNPDARKMVVGLMEKVAK